MIDLKRRYKQNKTFRAIVNSSSIKSSVDTEDGLDAIFQMERDLKKLLSSTDNRDFYLKYIGYFNASAFNLRRKVKYFISLYRKGRISDKSLIRDTYLDYKKKHQESIELYREKGRRWCEKNGTSLEDFRKNKK